jgi:hypothetical protein
MPKLTGVRLPTKYRRSLRQEGRVMRSDNLRAAPRWITREMVGRILDLAMPADRTTIAVATVPTRGVQPALAIVDETQFARRPAGITQPGGVGAKGETGAGDPPAMGAPETASPTPVSPVEHARRAEEGEADKARHSAAASPPRRKKTMAERRKEIRVVEIAHARGLAGFDVAKALGWDGHWLCKFATRRGLRFGRRPLLAEPITVEDILRLEDPALPLPPFRKRPRVTKAEGRRIGRYAGVLALHEQPEFQQLTKIAFDRGIAAADLGRALGRNIGTVLGAFRKLGLVFGKRPLLADPLTREQLLALADPTTPLPERNADRLQRLRNERKANEKSSREVERRPARQADRPAASREPAPVSPPTRAHPNPDRARMDRIHRAKSTAIQRRQIAQAEAFIESGKAITRATSANIKIAVRMVENRRAEDARLACPIEEAKRILQRRYAPVCSMAVYGGSPDRFVVGSKRDVTTDELLELAARIAA